MCRGPTSGAATGSSRIGSSSGPKGPIDSTIAWSTDVAETAGNVAGCNPDSSTSRVAGLTLGQYNREPDLESNPSALVVDHT